jgi:RNA polymerase sigma factor (sigma-70 family)
MAMALSMAHQDPRSMFLSDPQLYALVRNAVARRVPADHVDDIVQTTMLEAHASQTYPVDRAGFVRWLRLKARSNAIDWLRRRRRADQSLGEREGEDAESVPATSFVVENEARERLRFALTRIKDRPGRGRRALWLLRRAVGESFDEIGSADGVPAKTVERSVQRLQKDLRSAWIVAGVGVLVIALVRALLLHGEHYHEAHPGPAPTVEPAPSPGPTVPAPRTAAPDPQSAAPAGQSGAASPPARVGGKP